MGNLMFQVVPLLGAAFGFVIFTTEMVLVYHREGFARHDDAKASAEAWIVAHS